MATVYSDIATVQNAPTPSTLVEVGLLGGKVRYACAKYSGSDAAGTVINLVKLPKGARILPISNLQIEAGQGATLSVKVGDNDAAGADDDRYLAASVPGASAVNVVLGASALSLYKLQNEAWVQLTTGVVALTADKVIAAHIYYTIE